MKKVKNKEMVKPFIISYELINMYIVLNSTVNLFYKIFVLYGIFANSTPTLYFFLSCKYIQSNKIAQENLKLNAKFYCIMLLFFHSVSDLKKIPIPSKNEVICWRYVHVQYVKNKKI